MNTFEKSYRHELKYLISENTARLLKHKLRSVMKKDPHYDGYYNIRSLYFDDIYHTAYHDKIDGIIDRSKYRIRVYNLEDIYISVEIKGKHNDLSYKKKDIINKKEYSYLIKKEYDKIKIGDRKILDKLIFDIKNKNLVPMVIVDYQRLAYVYELEDTRITFDEEIKSSRFNYDLFDKNLPLFNVLEPNEILIEIKFNERLPYVIKQLLKEVYMTNIGLSKYALCMEKKGIDL